MSVHSTYRYGYKIGKLAIAFVTFTVNTKINAWENLFTIGNDNFKPFMQLRSVIDGNIAVYLDTNGYVGTQGDINTGTYNALFVYITG